MNRIWLLDWRLLPRDPRMGICAICHHDDILDEHGCCVEREECLAR